VSNGNATDLDFMRQQNEQLYTENAALKNEIMQYRNIESEIAAIKIKEEKYKMLIFKLHETKIKLEAKIETLSNVYTEQFDGTSLLHVRESTPTDAPRFPTQHNEESRYTTQHGRDNTLLTLINVEKILEDKKMDRITNYVATSAPVLQITPPPPTPTPTPPPPTPLTIVQSPIQKKNMPFDDVDEEINLCDNFSLSDDI
jgi:regulator of replication initiation timing